MTGFPLAELAAELTLDDGSVVDVPSGVHAPDPATRGRINVRVPCGEVPAGRRVARAVIRNAAMDVEAPMAYLPPSPVPLCGYLDVSVGAQDLIGYQYPEEE
jgi:hypothetical protein